MDAQTGFMDWATTFVLTASSVKFCQDQKESFASDISVYNSNLTAFGMKLLLEVSKGKLMMMSDIFSSTDCSLIIPTWMAQSKFPIEFIILIVMTTTPGNDLLSLECTMQ